MKDALIITIVDGPERDKNFTCGPGTIILGRDANADIVVPSTAASRRHAQIIYDGAHCSLEDLGSRNGTLVNGRLIRELAVLQSGDMVRIGEAVLKVTFGGADQAPSAVMASTPKPASGKPRKKPALPGQQQSSPLARVLIIAIGLIIAAAGLRLVFTPHAQPVTDSAQDLQFFEAKIGQCKKGVRATPQTGINDYIEAYNAGTSFYRLRRYREAMDMFTLAKDLFAQYKSRSANLPPDEQGFAEMCQGKIDMARTELVGQIVGKLMIGMADGRAVTNIVPGHYWTARDQEMRLHYEGAMRSWELVKMAAGPDHPFYYEAETNRLIMRVCLELRKDKEYWTGLTKPQQDELLERLHSKKR